MRHFIAILLLISSSFAAEKTETESSFDAGADWLEFYYRNPTPQNFVPQMKAWAADGTLQNHEAHPALIGFTAQLMRQNRDKIVKWATDLNGLDPKDLVVFNTALVFSRTGEADQLIKMSLGDKYNDFERPPKILEIPLNEPPAMNMLWGYFYATGSENALRKIIQGFRYEDAPLAPDGVEIPEGYKPYYTELPQLAFDSLYQNLQKHPLVLETCENFYANDKSLLAMEKRNLYDLLALIKPKEYPPRKVTKSDSEKDLKPAPVR
ncbi:MAG: hypothetical protein P1V20_24335 [Verrucomicrobiales bacterium]|nr:hypothetical protein [Verrucomicrobiales bacterium]